MDYRQTLDWLYQALPMYQRIGAAAYKKDLTNIRLLCAQLQHPEQSFASIHIAGTNGKGSTSHMLAAIFQATGMKVGLYTSPHYADFRERIRVNGRKIPEADVVDFVHRYREGWAGIQPSFFEMTVAMAFAHFRAEQVDIAVVETGLGGRLDSTNMLLPRLSVITNIGFDHMQMLGDTLPAIAGEKAGIIKPGVPVVIGEWHPATAPVFQSKAGKEAAPIHFASRHVRVREVSTSPERSLWQVDVGRRRWFDTLATDLTGPYQARNLRTVLEVIHQWNARWPGEAIQDEAVQRGLANVTGSTGMMGRWMWLSLQPRVIADAAHNLPGMKAMLPRLLSLPARRRHFVLGFVSDKDIGPLLRVFPVEGIYYWCAPDIPRRKPVGEVAAEARVLRRMGEAYVSVMEAYRAALKAADPEDLVFVGGSSFVVGDLLAGLGY